MFDRAGRTPQQVDRYTARLSGPLRDRIDLAVSVAALPPRDLAGDAGGEASSPIRERVVAARCRQLQRDGMLNSKLEGRRLRARVRLDAAARRLLEHAVSRLTLSARAFDRVLRVSRTIADLAQSEAISVEHLAEALQFRGNR